MREPPRQTPKAAFLLPAEEKSDRPFRGGRRRTGLCAKGHCVSIGTPKTSDGCYAARGMMPSKMRSNSVLPKLNTFLDCMFAISYL